jgi:hypothetical protein
MTGANRQARGVELAVADFPERLGANANRFPVVASLEGVRALCPFSASSDKIDLSGSFESKQEFTAVRMPARRADLPTNFIAVATVIGDATDLTYTGFDKNANLASLLPSDMPFRSSMPILQTGASS